MHIEILPVEGSEERRLFGKPVAFWASPGVLGAGGALFGAVQGAILALFFLGVAGPDHGAQGSRLLFVSGYMGVMALVYLSFALFLGWLLYGSGRPR